MVRLVHQPAQLERVGHARSRNRPLGVLAWLAIWLAVFLLGAVGLGLLTGCSHEPDPQSQAALTHITSVAVQGCSGQAPAAEDCARVPEDARLLGVAIAEQTLVIPPDLWDVLKGLGTRLFEAALPVLLGWLGMSP